jgi:uncharacterized iron-regulated membrane protein
MKKLIFNIHLYMALAAGAFILVLGLTGSIMAFEPELDHLLHRKLAYVTPGPHALSLAQIREAVERAYPGDQIQAYVLSTTPEISYEASMDKTGEVYVNQYTGEILGVRSEQEFLDYVHQLHIRLLWRGQSDPGKKIMTYSDIAALLLVCTGLYLWWPLKRAWVMKGTTGRRVWFDLHNVAGVFSFLFLLLLTLTGVMLGFERSVNPLLYRITGTQPAQAPRTFPPPPQGAAPLSPDQAVEIARAALPGAMPFSINVPGAKGAYQIRLRYPEDRTPGGRSRAVVDQYTGKVLFAEGSRTAPAGTRWAIAYRAVHTGDIFGMGSKMVMSAASLAMAFQLVSGLVMWRKRIRAKRDAAIRAGALAKSQ